MDLCTVCLLKEMTNTENKCLQPVIISSDKPMKTKLSDSSVLFTFLLLCCFKTNSFISSTGSIDKNRTVWWTENRGKKERKKGKKTRNRSTQCPLHSSQTETHTHTHTHTHTNQMQKQKGNSWKTSG